MIGLGLTAMGVGTRYASYYAYTASEGGKERPALRGEPDFEKSIIKIRDLDNPLKVCLAGSLLTGLVGLGITFVGLAYHHHRRHHELFGTHKPNQPQDRITV